YPEQGSRSRQVIYIAIVDYQLSGKDGVSEMAEEPKPQLIRGRIDVCELDRARMSLLNPQLIEQKRESRTIDENAKPLLELTMREGIETVWDRFEMQQPPCKYCESGLSCARCAMGPCRIIPPHRIRGVCGADADLIVARNLLDMIATGAAATRTMAGISLRPCTCLGREKRRTTG